MAVANLTISGAFNGHTGIVSVPSSFPGDVTAAGSLNHALQGYLDNLSASIQGINYSFENNDVAAGADYIATISAAAGGFEEFTNTDSIGGVSSVSANGAYTVSTGVTDVAVQAPGDVTLAGNGTTRFALFGASSNVTYTQSTGGSASIVAAGGHNAIFDLAANVNDTVYSSGNDTVAFNGTGGNDVVSVDGNASTNVLIGGSDAATVTASGNSSVTVLFVERAGGTLNFINNSAQAQTVFSGAYGSNVAINSITVNAGASGGYYVGGLGGNNSLVGGSGAVTFVGGGANDVLIGNSANGNNLFGGTGFETLLGATGSGNNLFGIGLPYPGIGKLTASGLVSTNGSGVQSFFIGNTNGETIAGSTVSGASNVYDIMSTSTTGGASLTITNFSSNSYINLTDGTGTTGGIASLYSVATDTGIGGGVDINLTDGTRIVLKGLAIADVATTMGSNGITTIYHA